MGMQRIRKELKYQYGLAQIPGRRRPLLGACLLRTIRFQGRQVGYLDLFPLGEDDVFFPEFRQAACHMDPAQAQYIGNLILGHVNG